MKYWLRPLLLLVILRTGSWVTNMKEHHEQVHDHYL
jgi:hypothetical protein